jgi:tetraacyldisaccharide 4'-kinase
LHAANRASVFAIPADDPIFESDLRTWGWKGPIWRLHRRMEVPPISGPVAAFCGIARPGQFFDGLIAGGLKLVSRTAFPDHYCYTERDLKSLQKKARNAEATALVTTDKDMIRLGNLISSFPASMPLKRVPLRIEIENETGALEWLTTRLSAAVVNASL